MYPHGLRIPTPFVSTLTPTLLPYHQVFPFSGFLLTEQTNSWRSSNSQRPNRYEHHRFLFPPPNRYRRLRRLWRLTRNLHMRLGPYNHLIYRNLPIPRENLVHSLLLSWAHLYANQPLNTVVGQIQKSAVSPTSTSYYNKLHSIPPFPGTKTGITYKTKPDQSDHPHPHTKINGIK